MKTFLDALSKLQSIEDNYIINSPIHRLNAVVKLTLTLVFVLCVVSFGLYEITGLIPYSVILFFILIFANLKIKDTLKSLLAIEPLIIILALSSALFNNSVFTFLGYTINGGFIVFISILFKTSLSVLSVILLSSVTKSTDIFEALSFYKVNKMFITVLFLIYRYIWVLLDEVLNTYTAYTLRAGSNDNGIKIKDMGSLLGQMIIRTADKGKHIYNAMLLRGYNPNKNNDIRIKVEKRDYLVIILGAMILVLLRMFDVIHLIGGIFV